MANNDLLVLNELTESGGSLRPSIQVERALAEIKDTFQTSIRQQRDFIAAYFLKA